MRIKQLEQNKTEEVANFQTHHLPYCLHTNLSCVVSYVNLIALLIQAKQGIFETIHQSMFVFCDSHKF